MFNSRLSTKMFDYTKETKTFSQEVSSLPVNFAPGLSYVMGKYVESLTLVSHKTGNGKVFVLKSTDTNREGEVEGWNFVSSDGLRVLIIND